MIHPSKLALSWVRRSVRPREHVAVKYLHATDLHTDQKTLRPSRARSFARPVELIYNSTCTYLTIPMYFSLRARRKLIVYSSVCYIIIKLGNGKLIGVLVFVRKVQQRTRACSSSRQFAVESCYLASRRLVCDCVSRRTPEPDKPSHCTRRAGNLCI